MAKKKKTKRAARKSRETPVEPATPANTLSYDFDAGKLRPESVYAVAEGIARDAARKMWTLMPVDDDYRIAQAMYEYLVENDVVNPMMDRQAAARFIQYAMKGAREFIASQGEREAKAAEIEERELNG